MPSLQEKNLLKALAAENHANVIEEDTANKLEHAYRFLRRIEHIIQYQNDEQTHLLPSSEEGLNTIALAAGMPREEFDLTLKQHREFVAETFKNVFRILGMNDEHTDDEENEAENSLHPHPSSINEGDLANTSISEELQTQFGHRTAVMLKNQSHPTTQHKQ